MTDSAVTWPESHVHGGDEGPQAGGMQDLAALAREAFVPGGVLSRKTSAQLRSFVRRSCAGFRVRSRPTLSLPVLFHQ